MIDVYKIGFTGTREWPSDAQQWWVNERLRGIGMLEFHNGACLGSDQFAHMVAMEYYRGFQPEPETFWIEKPIVVHPPIKTGWIMPHNLWQNHPLVKVEDPAGYHERDRAVVNSTQRLLATPKTGAPGLVMSSLGSGTWYTINYALSVGRTVEICYPDGQVEVREP